MAKKLKTIQEVKEYLGSKNFKKFTSPGGMYYSDRTKKPLNDNVIIEMVNDGIKAFGYEAFGDGKKDSSSKEKKTTTKLPTRITKWLDEQELNGYINKSTLKNIKTNLAKEPRQFKQLEKLILSADLTNNNKKTVQALARKYGLAEKVRGM